MRWKVMLEPWIRPFFHVYARFTRGVRIEVLGLILNAKGQILLVRQPGRPEWDLVRAAVSPDLGPEAALTEALRGGGGITLLERPILLSIEPSSRPTGDHKLLYRANGRQKVGDQASNDRGGICWAEPDSLPDGVGDEALAVLGATLVTWREG